MIIGTVKEIKNHEYRVGMTPGCVKAYVAHGHTVLVQTKAGEGTGFPDAEYEAAGAEIVDTAKEVFDRSGMIIKVKEPLPEEYDLLRERQILYTYLHLAACRELTQALIDRKVRGVAYETIERDGGLPCLKPMSEIAGRLSVQAGARCLEKSVGGRGVLLGGVPGVRRGRVAIIGGGTVGTNACKIAVGMGADVTVLDISGARMEYLDDIFSSRISTMYCNENNLQEVLRESDLVVGAVLVPGAKAPKLIRREHLALMKPGSVIADVAIDQGGCVETAKATTHAEPTYVVDDVIHYCVANMPGAVSLTSTHALTSTTLPYGLAIADNGLPTAACNDPGIVAGINTYDGKCTYENVAEAFNMEYTPVADLM